VSGSSQAGDRGLPFLAPPEPAASSPLAQPPTFSIVIATYEAAETVAASVISALEQTYPALEVIVVDDGSTDDVRGALRSFGDLISVIRKPNGGGASAMNAGAEVATGDFLAILDADDVYDRRRLAVLAALARERPDLDLITTDARFVVDGEETGNFAASNPFAVRDQRTAIFERCFVGGWPAVRLSRLRQIGGFDESLRTGYDWDCWGRLILGGSKAGLVEKPYYDYNLHGGSLTASRTSSMWDRVELLEKFAANPDLRPQERPALQRALRSHRSRAVIAETQAALQGSPPSTPLLRLAFAKGIRPRARLAAMLAAIAPPLARRLVPEVRPSAEQRPTAQP
jgi:glycosyltransferase involved in cell wall biosynthesis